METVHLIFYEFPSNETIDVFLSFEIITISEETRHQRDSVIDGLVKLSTSYWVRSFRKEGAVEDVLKLFQEENPEEIVRFDDESVQVLLDRRDIPARASIYYSFGDSSPEHFLTYHEFYSTEKRKTQALRLLLKKLARAIQGGQTYI